MDFEWFHDCLKLLKKKKKTVFVESGCLLIKYVAMKILNGEKKLGDKFQRIHLAEPFCK